jgi:prophage maintenance system killer protein
MMVDFSELYLDINEIRVIYERIQADSGSQPERWGSPQVICLESSIGHADSFLYYNAIELDPEYSYDSPDVVHRAAILMVKLIKSHCLLDGNNRLGWFCAMMILNKSGLTIDASAEEAELICKQISDTKNETNIDEIGLIRWFFERLSVI